MKNIELSSLAFRLRKTKAALLAVSLTLIGILLIATSSWLSGLSLGSWNWLHAVPLGELGGVLFGAGLLGTLFEYSFRRDQQEESVQRFKATIREEAPAMRDAVIEGFKFSTDDLARISTPQLLDSLAENSLGMRFGDPDFGREVYNDLKYQAISAEERWYDARVDAALGIPRGKGCALTPYFEIVVRWEYTVTPKHRFRRFAVVSDRRRYDELVAQRGETSVWFRRPALGMDVSDPTVFSLEHFTVDGRELSAERTADAVSQVYTVDLGDQVLAEGKPVVISFTFRAITARNGHVFHIDIDRPTKGLDLELTYDADAIAQMRLLDFASIGEGGRVSEGPDTATRRYRYDGWLFPRAGLVFVWTLVDELGQTGKPEPRTTQSTRHTRGLLHFLVTDWVRRLGGAVVVMMVSYSMGVNRARRGCLRRRW